MLCILPLQDWLATSENLRNPDMKAERINDPSNPHHYWRYRMHICLEDMMADAAFNEDVTTMIQSSGRTL
jgi:4-alpha-glucanotransferase